jgi:hypothetical protein
MNATLVASAVAMLTIVASVVAIAVTLGGSQQDAASAVLAIPASYTAEFEIEWRGAGGVPTGYTTQGVVSSSDSAGMSFVVHSLFQAARALTTTFVGGLLYANSSLHNYNDCVGAYTPLAIDSSSVSQQLPTALGALLLLDSNGNPGNPGNPTGTACLGGSLYSVSALHADHVLCVKNREPQWVQGDSYLLRITAFSSGAAQLQPPVNTNMTLCPPAGPEGEAPPGRRLGGPTPVKAVRSLELKPASDSPWWSHSSNRRLAAPLRHVCFMHGMGQGNGPAACGLNCKDSPAAANMANAGLDYWGNVAGYVPGGAAYTHVIHVNTLDRGWDSTVLQDTYYDYIRHHKCDVVFAHSMGNVILAALAARGKPVSWFMTQGPLRGSWGASWADNVCAQWYNPVGATAWALGYCASFGGGGNSAVKSLGVRNYKTTSSACDYGSCPADVGNGVAGWSGGAKELSWSTCWRCTTRLWGVCVAGYAAGQEVCADSGGFLSPDAPAYIKGRMCGSSAYGQGGFNGVGLAAIAGVVGYGEASDGMVSMSSCAQAGASRGQGLAPDARSNNYIINGNHADGTCRSGDGAGGDQKACTWFKNMILRGTGACPIPNACAAP